MTPTGTFKKLNETYEDKSLKRSKVFALHPLNQLQKLNIVGPSIIGVVIESFVLTDKDIISPRQSFKFKKYIFLLDDSVFTSFSSKNA